MRKKFGELTSEIALSTTASTEPGQSPLWPDRFRTRLRPVHKMNMPRDELAFSTPFWV
jgi:hypothetical protein